MSYLNISQALENDTLHSAVTYLTDFILEGMDKQELTGAVFIDLKKVFDLVDHECKYGGPLRRRPGRAT